jgi:hypothetical protein
LHSGEVISFYPEHTETFVASDEQNVILGRFSQEIEKPSGPAGQNLTGRIIPFGFIVTIRLRRPHLFMPEVTGRIEQTSKGSIIFLKYDLFPATRLLLLFWTIVLPLAGIFISYQSKNYFLVAGSFALAILIHVVAWANFKLHVKTTQKILYRIFQM